MHGFCTPFGTTYWLPAIYQSRSSDFYLFREVLEVLKSIVYRENGFYRSRGSCCAYIGPGGEIPGFNTSNTSLAVDQVWERLRGRFQRAKTMQPHYLPGEMNSPGGVVALAGDRNPETNPEKFGICKEDR
jgi:hypothetical protein